MQLVLEVEIRFFVVQRNVLMPSDFNSLTRLRDRLLCFREYCEQVAQPFQWKFTRQGLNRLTGKLSDYEVGQRRAAWAAGNTSPNSPGEVP